MEKAYRTAKEPATAEFCERRSRFIGYLQPVSSEEEVQAFLTALRREHRDARHVCFAYRVGDAVRFSDDGEPAGTAGQPLLQILEHNDLSGVVLAVVRYFGGILLGAGGLLRAYSHTGALTVDAASLVTMRTCKVYELQCDYAAYGFVRPLLEQKGTILDSRFEDEVTLTAALLEEDIPFIEDTVTEQSAGRLKGKITGECSLPFGENEEK